MIFNNMLMKCPECQKEVSSKALSCPHCGYPLKNVKKEENLNVKDFEIIAKRGKRKIHNTTFAIAGVATGVLAVLGTIFLIYLINDYSIASLIFVIVCGAGLFCGIFGMIRLGIWLNTNSKNHRDNIYYIKEKESFLFIDIFGHEVLLSKNEEFSLRDNARNMNELVMFHNGARYNLGFTITPINVIKEKISSIKGE